jgi:heat shock protein HtpX
MAFARLPAFAGPTLRGLAAARNLHGGIVSVAFWRQEVPSAMKRVLLFLATNFAIVIVLSISANLLEGFLAARGIHIPQMQLMIWAFVFGMGGSFISLLISKWMAIRVTGAHVIDPPQSDTEAWLLQTVSHHARAAGIGMPQVAIFPSDAPNAFATGARRDSALVAVSTGLLQRMRREEIAAVLGHEVSHIANGDMVTLALIQGVLNTFVLLLSRVIGGFVDRVVFRNEGRGYGIGYVAVVIATQLLLGVLASIIVFWFSRRREFRADGGGARLAGRAGMIGALRRLQESEPQPLPEQMRAFGIDGSRSAVMRLFMSHPPLAERIAALERAPI